MLIWSRIMKNLEPEDRPTNTNIYNKKIGNNQDDEDHEYHEDEENET